MIKFTLFINSYDIGLSNSKEESKNDILTFPLMIMGDRASK